MMVRSMVHKGDGALKVFCGYSPKGVDGLLYRDNNGDCPQGCHLCRHVPRDPT